MDKSLGRKVGRVEITIKKQLTCSNLLVHLPCLSTGLVQTSLKQGNQKTTKEKENKPDLTFQILLK